MNAKTYYCERCHDYTISEVDEHGDGMLNCAHCDVPMHRPYIHNGETKKVYAADDRYFIECVGENHAYLWKRQEYDYKWDVVGDAFFDYSKKQYVVTVNAPYDPVTDSDIIVCEIIPESDSDRWIDDYLKAVVSLWSHRYAAKSEGIPA